VRENYDGDLRLLVYGKAVGMAVDPIEKKPLFHFLPGTTALSFGTLGCNFSCTFCQNWFQSQSPKQIKVGYAGDTDHHRKLLELINQVSRDYTPLEIVELAQEYKCPTIAYTYNEPAVFIEYAYDTMVLAKERGLRNVFVSNGYESIESFELIKDYLDAANIDLKSFRSEFYERICGARLEPVLDNIRRYYEAGIWVEVTTLIIPGENDSREELEQIARFLVEVSPDIPWHVTAFHPDYKMRDKPPTSPESLRDAWKIGRAVGLNYVYTGNILDTKHVATYCPMCGAVLVRRDGYGGTEAVELEGGKCPHCGSLIPGVWV